MNIATHCHLAPSELLRLPPGRQFACDSGCLWVTEDGQLHDTVLRAGQVFLPTANGRLLVTAFTPSQLHWDGASS
jgi:hypothetical protein